MHLAPVADSLFNFVSCCHSLSPHALSRWRNTPTDADNSQNRRLRPAAPYMLPCYGNVHRYYPDLLLEHRTLNNVAGTIEQYRHQLQLRPFQFFRLRGNPLTLTN